MPVFLKLRVASTRLSFRQILNDFPGEYSTSGTSTESQAALVFPSRKAMSCLHYPPERFEVSSLQLW